MELIDVAVTRLAGHEGTVEVSHRAAGCRRGLEFGEVVRLRGGAGQTCLARVADIEACAVDAFEPPRCERCGGLLKPDVVFFGENVPGERVEDAHDALARADALLVAGSSLMVYSGFRFVRFARDLGLPIAIVNRGRTRGDDLAEIKVEGDVGALLGAALS
jgi:NAD-dependent SIR2 family protein deacetylase